MDPELVPHIVEVEQLCARYGACMTAGDTKGMMAVFTEDGTYSAFGEIWALPDLPDLVEAAPKGLFLCGTPALQLDLTTGTGTGEVPLLFVDMTNHAMRMGWYTDTYLHTEHGWRLRTRRMTFLRRSGARDAGKAHDPLRPAPSAVATS